MGWHSPCYTLLNDIPVNLRRFPRHEHQLRQGAWYSRKGSGFRAQRAEVLANNIANADTPNYKARDMDFASVLAAESDKQQSGRFAMDRTNSRHIEAEGLAIAADDTLKYRTPLQPSIDQNTVDAQIEQSNYTENAIGFQASFTLLNSKFKGLVSALRGE